MSVKTINAPFLLGDSSALPLEYLANFVLRKPADSVLLIKPDMTLLIYS